MNEQFSQWVNEHIEELLEKGIVSEIPEPPRAIAEKQVPNLSQAVYYYSPTHV